MNPCRYYRSNRTFNSQMPCPQFTASRIACPRVAGFMAEPMAPGTIRSFSVNLMSIFF